MAEAPSTRQPLLWAALAFAAGIIAGVYVWRPALWWLLAALVFLVAALRFRHRVSGLALSLTALSALGAWSVQAHDGAEQLPSLSAFADGQEVTILCHVKRDGLLRGHAPHQTQSLDVETETITRRDGRTVPLAAGIRLSVFDAPGSDDDGKDEAETDSSGVLPSVFTYGQRLWFSVKLREPRNFRNPGAWDYRGYLLQQGIVATGSVAAHKIEVWPGIAGSRWDLWCSRTRRSVMTRIHRLWPSEQAGLFDAMLIGERSLIGHETNTAWQRTGIYHILVVSGMNVGILATVLFGLLRRFRTGAVLATVLTIVLASGYAWLADLGAPVLRSVLMLTVFLMMRLLYRPRALLNAIGAAALVLLVANPRSLFDASFQLTFISVVAIAGLAVPILDRTSAPVRQGLRWLPQPAYDTALPPRIAQFRLDLRMLARGLAGILPVRTKWAERLVTGALTTSVRIALLFYEVVVVSAICQMAMSLPMAFYFHRATVTGLAANTMAVPLTGILMTTSALALALSYLWLPLAKIPALIAGWALSGITWVVNTFGSLRISDVRLPTPSLVPCLAVALTLVLAMFLVRRRALAAAFGMLLLVAACVWLSVRPARLQLHPGVLEVTSIDVGQAESTLVVTPQGRTLLVDAAGPLGPWHSDFDFGENVIAPYLWSRGISRLDAVLLTHAHSDHMGGMPGVVAIFHPRELWLGPNSDSRALDDLRHTAAKYGVSIRQRSGGEQLDFGGAHFEVLAPPMGWRPAAKTRNNDSLVIRASYGATSALLTADAEKQIESYLVSQHPSATLLKVGHNGSKTSTNPEFLAAVHPQLAIISVGAHNSFGHPRPEVLQRLGSAHVSTYRTDINGAMTFLLDGRTVRASQAMKK
jgi:competence protein ComEC